MGLLIAGIPWLSACSVSTNYAALERAEESYLAARDNPAIDSDLDASAVLDSAEIDVVNANNTRKQATLFGEREDPDQVDHHAYIIERKVSIARAVAAKNAADQQIAQLSVERDQLMVAAREREARDRENAEREAAVLIVQRAQEEEALAQIPHADVARIEDGLLVSLKGMSFPLEEATLTEEMKENLEPLATFLQEHPDRKLTIEGHTDDTGPVPFNDTLSEHRAIAVKTFLIDQGISPQRLTSRGRGQSSPLAPNDSDEGREQNRRFEIVIQTAAE